MTSVIESGLQLFCRLNTRPIPEKLHQALFKETLYPGSLVEIRHEGSSAKTLLLTDLIARCLLPMVEGLRRTNCNAVLINVDQHFDITQLLDVMKLYSQDNLVAESHLQNLFVLNCYNHEQLEIAFHYLERLLQENPDVGAVFLDGIATQYWDYRQNTKILSLQSYCAGIINSIQKSIKNYNVLLIFTVSVEVQLSSNFRIILKDSEGAVVNCSTKVLKEFTYDIVGNTIDIK